MKGNGTAPITINGAHMVRASLTPVEAWPPLSPHMLLFMVCDFSSNLRQFNFLPTSQRNVRLTDWSIDVERLSSHIVLAVKLILLSLVWPMNGQTQYSLLHILPLKIRIWMQNLVRCLSRNIYKKEENYSLNYWLNKNITCIPGKFLSRLYVNIRKLFEVCVYSTFITPDGWKAVSEMSSVVSFHDFACQLCHVMARQFSYSLIKSTWICPFLPTGLLHRALI